jgi:hypothetical protein
MLKIQKLCADSQSKVAVEFEICISEEKKIQNMGRLARARDNLPATMSGCKSCGDEPSKNDFKEF